MNKNNEIKTLSHFLDWKKSAGLRLSGEFFFFPFCDAAASVQNGLD